MRIVFVSFRGHFSDSPRAIYEELLERGVDAACTWLTAPHTAASFPDDVATATFGSPGSIAALESADLVVSNDHIPLDWEKRPETTYLQTWHGTPLKRIHWDVLWAPEGRLERLQRDVDQWDLLVSPNRASTPLLRRAFRYDGEVLETGYPRNDVLNAADRDEIRARVRRQLEIPDGVTAVLYTPTWRDDVVFAEEAAGPFALGLDVDAFAEALGDDHVLLLRLHYMLTGRLEAYEHPAVRDVSFHPEVSELYLAADVLVTDYSSTMFDFAVTGKPLLFYTYDLDDYESRVRGFYFDLASIAPGPLVRTTEELLGALAELPRVTAEHADAYAHFRETFCHLDDGHASERVLDRVLRTQAPRPATAR